MPTPVYIGSSTIRLYYSTKINDQSHIYFIEISEESLEIISDPKEAMRPGIRGAFDDAGVMPSCIVDGNMYYSGWNLRREVPYSHAIGRGKIRQDGTIERIFDGPVLNVNKNDPFLVNSPCVIEESGNYIMYYCSGTGWHGNFPSYCIKKATSLNGSSWITNSEKEITFGIDDEAISRVCYDSSVNLLYFSMKTKDTNYRIYYCDKNYEPNYLEIEDGTWDSDMQCYPHLYNNNGFRYLFYNGNGYGQTGIGVAKWKEATV